MTAELPRAVAIVGPTAAGKSELAMSLAIEHGLPIVACDSVQVYRGLDIGSAKPDLEARARVRHECIDLVDPDDSFSAGRYGAAAYDVLAREPGILCGGTGLYLRAATFELGGASPDESDATRRDAFEARWWAAERDEPGAAHRALAAIDAETAARIHPRNVVRTVRSLWLCEWHGEPISAVRDRDPPRARLDVLHVVLAPETAANAAAIESRCHRMLSRGWLREVEMLIAAGYDRSLRSMQSLGYKQLGDVVRGERSLEDATREIVTMTRQYAKRQRTWFRHQLPAERTVWIEHASAAPREGVSAFLTGAASASEVVGEVGR